MNDTIDKIKKRGSDTGNQWPDKSLKKCYEYNTKTPQ